MDRQEPTVGVGLQETVEVLRESEERLRLFIEHAPALIAMFDRDMRYLAWSRRWLTAHKLGDEDLFGRAADEVFPHFPEQWYAVHDRCLAGSVERSDLDQLVLGDGTVTLIRWEVRPWHRADGTIGGTIVFSEDITERMRAEEALRESEERFRVLVEAKAQAVWEATPEGESLGDSLSWRHYTGQSYDEYEGFGSFDAIHPDDRDRVKKRWFDAIRQETPFDEEFRIRTTDGRWCWTNSVGAPIRDEAGKVVKWIGMNLDVTQRYLYQQAIREREQQLRTVVENAPMSIAMFDRDMNYLAVSQQALRNFGLEGEDLIGRNHYEVFPDIPEPWKQRHARCLAGASERFDEDSMTLPDGRTIYFTWEGMPWRTPDGEIGGLIVYSQDITNTKLAEIAIRESEQRLRAFIDNAPVHIVMFDRQYRVLAASRRWQTDMGLHKREFIGKPIYEHFEDFPADWLRSFDAVLLDSDGEYRELRWERANGEVHYFRWSSLPWKDSSGDIGGIVVFSEDITERRRHEMVLREGEERLKMIIQNAPGAVALFDRDMNYLAVNVRHFFYIDPAEVDVDAVIGKNHYEVFPQLPERWKEIHRRCLSGAVEKCEKDIFVCPDGTIKYLCWEIRPWWTSEGEVGGITIFGDDITERIRANQMIDQIVDSVTPRTGSGYFEALVQQLTVTSEADWAAVGEFVYEGDTPVVNVVAICHKGELGVGPTRYELVGTPCEHVFEGWEGEVCFVPSDAGAKFPRDEFLSENGIEAYMGIPLTAADGKPLGLIWVVRCQPFSQPEQTKRILKVVAARSAAELERQQSERARQESEFRYRDLVENTSDLCFSMNAEGKYIYANQALLDILGYTADEFYNLTFRDLVIPSTLDRTEELHQRFVSGEKDSEKNVRSAIRAKDGRVLKVEGNVSVRRFPDRPPYIRGIYHDITEREQAEEKRRTLEAEILHAEKLKSLGILAGGIAHDFNNILTVITNYSAIASSTANLDRDVRHALQQIDRATGRAAQLCKTMLAYSGRDRFVVEPINLSVIVRETKSLLQVTFSKKTWFSLDLAEGLPAIEADSSQVRQVIMNLVTNASEAIGEHEGEVSLETGLVHINEETLEENLASSQASVGEFVYAKVTDTGCGMDQETRARVFDPFFSTKQTGRGLGMAAVLGVVRAHHGVILCESIPGKGTTFTVAFPQVAPTVVAQVPVRGQESVDLTDSTILVVDDEPIVRKVIAKILQSRGSTVLEAEDGQEGVEVYKANADRISLSIVDMSMPRLNGRECLRAIRSLTPDARVILVSGYSEEPYRSHAEAPNGFLKKPFHPAELTRLVEEVLGANARSTLAK